MKIVFIPLSTFKPSPQIDYKLFEGSNYSNPSLQLTVPSKALCVRCVNTGMKEECVCELFVLLPWPLFISAWVSAHLRL